MGVTIRFEGRLKTPESLQLLIEAARTAAQQQGWQCMTIAERRVHLARVKDGEDWDYVGPTRGIVLLPHAFCDPLRLEFDFDLYVQEYVKTQFAGAVVHAQVIGILHGLEHHFENLVVEDEGEYWSTGDRDLLDQRIEACERAMVEYLTEHPTADGPVRLDSGRWIDVLS
jgi:hypothetical protein